MSSPFAAPDVSDAPVYADAPLAELGPRFMAAIVDTVIAYAAFVPMIGVVVVYDLVGEVPDDPPPLFIVVGLACLAAAIAVAIYQWWQISVSGQTIGKRMMGIRIVRTDGSPVDFVTGVLLRSWVLGFLTGILNQCCLGWVIFVVDVALIFGPERQCLHDRLASTKVVVATET